MRARLVVMCRDLWRRFDRDFWAVAFPVLYRHWPWITVVLAIVSVPALMFAYWRSPAHGHGITFVEPGR